MFQRLRAVTTVLAVLATASVAAAQNAAGGPPESTAVPPEQWKTLPPIDWAGLLFKNQVGLSGSRTMSGGMAFLVRAATGQTVAVSPYFQFGDIDPADARGAITSWSLARGGVPAAHVRVGAGLMPTDACRAMKCMMEQCDPPPAGTAVLAAADGPFPAQTWGYFVTPDPAAAAGLTVYRAVIVGPDVKHHPGVFCFGIYSKVNPATFESGVVLDGQGRVLGIQTGYYPEDYQGKKITCSAASVPELLAAAHLPVEPPPAPDPPRPAPVAAAPAPPAKAAAPAKPVPPPAAAVQSPSGPPAAPKGLDEDDPGEKALRVARMYESPGQYERARQKLRQLIQAYPGTPAAAAATADLRSIDGK